MSEDLAAFLSGPGAVRVVKRRIPVQARFAVAAGVVHTLEGPVRHAAGDAVLTGVQGERWPVARARFLASYDPVPPGIAGEDGAYLKRPAIAVARRLNGSMAVPVGNGDVLRGQAGDWVLGYSDGSFGVVGDGIFRETYGPADQRGGS